MMKLYSKIILHLKSVQYASFLCQDLYNKGSDHVAASLFVLGVHIQWLLVCQRGERLTFAVSRKELFLIYLDINKLTLITLPTAFCRKPPPCSTKAEYEKMMKDGTTGLFCTLYEKEDIKRTKNLVESGSTNADAYFSLGAHYDHGSSGLPQDYEKSNELYLRAGELGCAEAYYNLGISYENGEGVEVDTKKAEHYWELAAMKGNVQARYNLACLEGEAGNKHRAWKHFLLAARAGDKDSLERVKDGFKWNLITKDEYADALRAYHKIHDESKSDDRDAHEEFLSGGSSEE